MECDSRRRDCINCLLRAVRTTFGIMVIGVLTSYGLSCLRDDSGPSMCQNLESKLKRLEAECSKRRSQGNVAKTTSQAKTSSGCPQLADSDIRAIIKDEMSTYAYDTTGMPDFALEKLGACIVTTRNTKDVVVSDDTTYFGLYKKKSDPREILRPSLAPGDCWAFDGSSGTAIIRLMGSVFIDGISLEHVSPLLTPTGEISSAPKTFSLWGLDSASDTEGKHKFGTFVYQINGPTVQTFRVQTPNARAFHLVEVSFHDNHGNQFYTCVYRVRIHGKIDV